MKVWGKVCAISGLLISVASIAADRDQSVQINQQLVEKLRQDVLLARNGDSHNVYRIRLNSGLLYMPKAFFLHTGQSKGRYFQLESEPFFSSELALSDIWIWNAEEAKDLDGAYERSEPVDSDDLTEKIKRSCKLNSERRSIDVPIDGTRSRLRQEYLLLGDQVISWTPELEPVLQEMMLGFVDENCGRIE